MGPRRHRPQHLVDGPRRGRIALAVVAVLVLAGGATALAIASSDDDPAVAATGSSSTTTAAPPTTASSTTTTTLPPPRTATVAFGGDVLIHSGVWRAAATGAGYDFTPMLAPITPQLSAADLAICHLEVTLARPGDALSGYPRFRAPTELAADLAEAGYDGCSVSSNHALDFGEPGVVATLDALDQAGLAHVGTARSPEEDAAPAVYDAAGITVAQLSYAYGFNGFVRPSGKEWLADQIDPALILADADAARAAGAEVVVVSMHWGNEYRHEVVEAQQTVADALAAVPGAVDLIVGHHAHVVQPISKVGQLWVVWGMGNQLSNNATRCCPGETADGVIVTVTIGDTAGGVAVTDIAFTPTWNERSTFRVLPAAATVVAGAEPALEADLRASYQRTVGYILGLGASDLGVAPDEVLP
jgi:poly-gamma-glutamate capsule biosynthesis protein CapA/YwtB (metallophosphatase superfamily)